MTDAAPTVDEIIITGYRRGPKQSGTAFTQRGKTFLPPKRGGLGPKSPSAAPRTAVPPSQSFVPPLLPPVIEEILVVGRSAPPAIGIPLTALGVLGGLVYGIYKSGQRSNERARKARQDKRDRLARSAELAPSSESDLSLPSSLADLLQSPTEIALDPYAFGYFASGIDAPSGGDGRIEEIFVTGTAPPPIVPPRAPPTANPNAFDWYRWIKDLPDFDVGDPVSFGSPMLEIKPKAEPKPKAIPLPYVVPDAPGILVDPRDNPFGVPDYQPIMIPSPLANPRTQPTTRPTTSPRPGDLPKSVPAPFSNPYASPFFDPYVGPGTKPNVGNKPKNKPKTRPGTRPLTGPRNPPVPLFGVGPQTDTFLTPQVPIKTDTCTCAKKKDKKRERKKRTVCSRGTYVKRTNGIDYKVTENIPCR